MNSENIGGDLTMNEYQGAAHTTAGPYEAACVKMAEVEGVPGVGVNGNLLKFLRLTYLVNGLTGEAGEIANKAKKVLRDNDGVLDDVRGQAIAKELGDVLWYLAEICTLLKVSLADVAAGNVMKLIQRKNIGTLTGDGDDR